MGDFNKFRGNRGGDRKFGGGGKFGGGNRFGGAPRQMFATVCSTCGQSCEVPFRPTGERPVYCNNCFKSQGGNDRGDRFSSAPKRFGGPSVSTPVNAGGSVSKAQFDMLNAKLDKILSALNITKTQGSDKKEVAKVEVKAPSIIKVATDKKAKAPAKKIKGRKK